ncbi:MAG: class I SAM-dependent methyltransferase [candidate division Zixibacteria bacterium]|nr:class I SAM-dependent methyltransferase [candidate division Zixibacteria bacterium]
MATESRWNQAQSYEKSFWESASKKIGKGDSGQLSWYKWRADNLLKLIAKAIPENTPSFKTAKVLEIGSGPVGITAFFGAAEKYAIDPLCDFYASKPELVKLRGKDVVYKNEKGENLPFENAYFDLIIIENVIDHVQNADGVMKEMSRLLKPNSILYLTVNLHPLWGATLHEIVSRLRIDKGHPHTFTIPKIRRFLSHYGFKITYEEWENYKDCRANDLKSDSRKGKLKGISGLSEFLFTSISTKSI